MRRILHDTRLALRLLRQRPGFTVVAVLTLAFGIGANTAIFSLVNGVLFKGVPGITDREGLVEISQTLDGGAWDMPYAAYSDLRERSRTVPEMAAYAMTVVALRTDDAEPTVHTGLAVTGNYFSVLGLTPSAGRFFPPKQSFHPDTVPAAVIGHRFWATRFDSRREILGRTLLVNDYPVTILGVAPEGFHGHRVGLQVDVFVVLGTPAPGLPSVAGLENAATGELEVLGRLAPDASGRTAAAELSLLAGQFRQQNIEDAGARAHRIEVAGWGPVPGVVRGGVRAFLGVLMTVVGLVMALACNNVAGMLLSRNSERRKEIATRLALGAGRGQIVQQLMTESLVLFSLGGALGAMLAVWWTPLLFAFDPPLPPGVVIDLDVSPDLRVLGFSLFVTLACGLLFSLLPALRAVRPDLVPALKDGVSTTPERSRLRGLLVGAQMTATVVLLVAAGLFLQALRTMDALDPGFDPERVYALNLDLELKGYGREQGGAFYRDLGRRVDALPGVEASGLARKLPLGGRSSLGPINVDTLPARNGVGHDAFFNTVSPGYLDTLGLNLLQGRDVAEVVDPDGPIEAVINRTMARRFWPDGDAVGKQFYVGQVGTGTPIEVVGVVRDAKYRELVEETPNFYYLPLAQRYNSQMILHVRMAPGSAGAIASVRDLVRGMDPGLPVPAIRLLDEQLETFFLPQRLAAWVAGTMGLLGLALAAVGIYGVASFAAAQRTHEMGVRLALGARPADVLQLMIGRGLRAPLVGMVVGLAIATGFSIVAGTVVLGVRPLDPATFGVVIFTLGVVATFAVALPARRASRLDPARVLRSE